MQPNIAIRDEVDTDMAVIAEVTAMAFMGDGSQQA